MIDLFHSVWSENDDGDLLMLVQLYNREKGEILSNLSSNQVQVSSSLGTTVFVQTISKSRTKKCKPSYAQCFN